MNCPTCQTFNPETVKFCGECGTPLRSFCPNCQHQNAPTAKFCTDCGCKLSAVAVAIPATTGAAANTLAPELPTQLVGERRQLTVMFCDLVGSTALSEQLDPEDLRDVTREYQEVCSQVIRRFDGQIAKYLGDGILVYFGFPIAHEDDASRTVRTALGIVEAIGRLNQKLDEHHGIRLSVRIGIHTGLVVIDEIGASHERVLDVIGETPNIAARLQGMAEDNQIVMSAATHRLVEGYFECVDLGPQLVKGLTRSVVLYNVVHESAARSRFDLSSASGQRPLVGRTAELDLMLRSWDDIKHGKGQTVLLSGEAGLGKSRLLFSLKEAVARDPKAWLTECRTSSYQRSSSLYPVVDLLQTIVLQFTREDSAAEKLAKIEGFLVQYGFDLVDTVPLLASLLGVPASSEYPPSTLTPAKQKELTMNLLVDILLRRAEEQPVLFIVEDLHWADASTIELVDLLMQRGQKSKLLIVLTFRPEWIPTFMSDSALVQIHLTRFSREQTERMVLNLTGGLSLPPEVLNEIVNKTDGVALFIEELTRMVLESDLLVGSEHGYTLKRSGPLPPLAIPASLNDSLMARLDKLSPVKLIAQLASVIGREVPFQQLKAVSKLPDHQLIVGLQELVDSEILFQRGQLPNATFYFKHALIQEASYESLLKSTRQSYHTQIVEMLETMHPETATTHPELLAHHYSEAGLLEKAIQQWLAAGQLALARSANKESVEALDRGLQLLKGIADETLAMQLELPMQVTRGMAFIYMRGYASDDVVAAFGRAREICDRFGETPQIAPVLWGLWAFYVVRGEFAKATETANELAALADRSGDDGLIIESKPSLGHIYWTGDLLSAERHFGDGVRLYDIEKFRSHAAAYGQDPGVVSMAYYGWILSLRGRPNEGMSMSRRGVELARLVPHVYSETYATIFEAVNYMMLRMPEKCLELALSAGATSAKYGFPIWTADSLMLSGWAHAMLGDPTTGVEETKQGIAIWHMIGAELWLSQAYGILAQNYILASNWSAALETLDTATGYMEKNGERIFESEIYRLRALALLGNGSPKETAIDLFERALVVARAQGALLFEVHALIELVRHALTPEAREHHANDLVALIARFENAENLPAIIEATSLIQA